MQETGDKVHDHGSYDGSDKGQRGEGVHSPVHARGVDDSSDQEERWSDNAQVVGGNAAHMVDDELDYKVDEQDKGEHQAAAPSEKVETEEEAREDSKGERLSDDLPMPS